MLLFLGSAVSALKSATPLNAKSRISVLVSSGCERTFRVELVMAYSSTVNYFLAETINRIRDLLFPSYTTNDYSSFTILMSRRVQSQFSFKR